MLVFVVELDVGESFVINHSFKDLDTLRKQFKGIERVGSLLPEIDHARIRIWWDVWDADAGSIRNFKLYLI